MRGVNRRRLLLLVVAAAAGLVLLGILGAANYAAAQRRAAAFSLKPTSSVPRPTATPSAVANRLQATCATPASIARADDLWVAGAGTMAGYRAHETFLDITLPHEAVARTDQVVGNLRVRQLGPAQIAIQGGCFAVELNTLTSIDELPGRRAQDRDELYGDFLDTRDYPYAVLTLHRTEVPVFSSRPQHVIVAGDLSVAGATHPVAVAVDAQTVAGGVQAVGSMAIDAHDFGIRLPGEGDPIVVDSHLTLEFLLVLEQIDHQIGAN